MLVGQRVERRRHDAHAGDARDDDVEVVAWLEKIAPNRNRKSSGSTKLKNAARRVAPEHPALEAVLAPGERARPQPSVRPPRCGLGGQLEVDVLERSAASPTRSSQRARRARARALVSWCSSAVGSSVSRVCSSPCSSRQRDAVARRRRAELAGGPSARIAPVLDDRDAVAQRLRLVEVVRGEQDRLAELLQARGSSPTRRGAPRGRSRSSARRGRRARGRRRARARGRAAARWPPDSVRVQRVAPSPPGRRSR